jgi:anion-transporting  ArsA/GET3 family ATPase
MTPAMTQVKTQQELDTLALVDKKHIILCCGSGGVGKTTTSAALGLLAASRGRSVLVLTIDPAKRLAQAMGLDTLSHNPQPIDISNMTGIDGKGSLHGMMLDTKRTFDNLVERYAPDQDVKQAILDNSYYQHISSSLAGSREFMAMERVYEIAIEEDYDLVVVDTPPSQHALDFIDAPQRMFDLFEGRFLKILLKPTKAIGKRSVNLVRRSSGRYLKFLERLTGYQFLTDLSDFFVGFSGMFEGFKERSERVRELLQQADSSFLLVCAPEPSSLSEAERFFERLHGEHMPVGGMIVNRVHRASGPEELTDDVGTELRTLTRNKELTERMLQSYQEQNALAHADGLSIQSTEVAKKQMPIHQVPYFEHDLHSLEDIQTFANKLY